MVGVTKPRPRFPAPDLEWLYARYREGQHAPRDHADVFVIDEGMISLEIRGLYVLWSDDGAVLRTGRKLADVMP
jgi:hypothetical protein